MVVPSSSWQVGSLPSETVIPDGVPTVGITFTVLITCEEGPLQPFALTCIFTLPEKPFAQVITPEAGSIVPADPLLNDQLKPVLLAADVE